MKLVHSEYGISFEFQEGVPEILVLEKPCLRREFLKELWQQCNTGNGNFILSDKKALKMEKEIDIIINPFCLDFQNRKITSTLYSKMAEIANEKTEEKSYVNGMIINLLESILNSVNYHGIAFQLDFSWADLFKMYGVKIESSDDIFLCIIEYCKVISQLCAIKLLILVDIKKYLSEDELLQLYKNASYNKLSLLLIESCESKHLSGENVTIIDQDLCVIKCQ